MDERWGRISNSGSRWDPPVHGVRPIGRNGVQSTRGPRDRRRESADSTAAFARRAADAGIRWSVSVCLLRSFCAVDARLSAEAAAAVSVGSGAVVPAGILLDKAVHDVDPLLVVGSPDAVSGRSMDRDL